MGLLLGSGTTKPQYPYDQWYGIQGDILNNDYHLTRVGNLDLHRTLPIQSKIRRFVENTDGTVKYYLHQNDSRLKDSGATAIIDGTDENVMLEKPEYYFRMEIDGTKWIRAYSEYPLPGFVFMSRKTVSPWDAMIDLTNNIVVSGSFLTWNGNDIARDANGIVMLKSNAAQFRGGFGTADASLDGTYNSQLGMPRTALAKSTVRPLCKNGTHIGAYRAYNELAWLQRLEYASLNSQSAYNATLTTDGYKQGGLGEGPTVDSTGWNTWGAYRPFIPAGVTATLGNNTGYVSYTVKNWNGADKIVSVNSYRGLELPFDYLWLLVDDVLIYHDLATLTNKSIAYVCSDPTKFTSPADSATTIPDGYVSIANLSRISGWILQLTHADKGYSFPSTVGGSAVLGACDYFYTPVDGTGWASPGWYGALLSAHACGGAGAGFGCLATHYRSSLADAHFGFRLCRF